MNAAGSRFRIRLALASDVAASPANWGANTGDVPGVTRVIGDSGYPALLSATGWDDDLVQVMYDSGDSEKPNLLISPISLP